MTTQVTPMKRDEGSARTSSAARLPLIRRSRLDPPQDYRRLQAEDPISRLAFPDGRDGWLVTRYDDVRAALADPRLSSRRSITANPVRKLSPEIQQALAPQPGQFIVMDPPEHTRYRRLLTGQFTVRRMHALQPRIAQIVAEHLTAMAHRSPPVDLVAAFALPIPSLVICELLGVPYADRALFQRLSAALLSLTTDGPTLLQVRNELRGYMHTLVQAKRQKPADDLLSGLVGDGGLTDEELVSIGTLLLVAGHETTANMLALGTLTLLQHPKQLAALRADPDLVDGAVEELLRYLSIIQFGLVRIACQDLELGGRRIRAGEPVVLSLAAANRDPATFVDPDRLDVTRGYSPHLAFGHGVHQCLGQQLARVEMRIGYTTLLHHFPSLQLAVPVEQVRMRDDMVIYGVHELPVSWDSERR